VGDKKPKDIKNRKEDKVKTRRDRLSGKVYPIVDSKIVQVETATNNIKGK
jgi:hypothetical protein